MLTDDKAILKSALMGAAVAAAPTLMSVCILSTGEISTPLDSLAEVFLMPGIVIYVTLVLGEFASPAALNWWAISCLAVISNTAVGSLLGALWRAPPSRFSLRALLIAITLVAVVLGIVVALSR